jgi:hypothetical protein
MDTSEKKSGPAGAALGFLLLLTALSLGILSPGVAQDAGGQARRGSRSAVKGQVVVSTPWGSGPAELGRVDGDESDPVGPASLNVHPDGDIYVLDTVNGRIQVYGDGRHKRSIPLPRGYWEDLVFAPGGQLVLLDRLLRRAVIFLDREGDILREVPVEGLGVPETAGITQLVSCPDGIWVQYEGNGCVRVALLDGSADPQRRMALGLPIMAGQEVLHGRISGEVTVTLYRGTMDHRKWTAFPVPFKLPVSAINLVAADELGRIFLAAHLVERDPKPVEREEVVVLDQGGRQLERFEIPVPTREHQVFRPLTVTRDGIVFAMSVAGEQAEIRRFRP